MPFYDILYICGVCRESWPDFHSFRRRVARSQRVVLFILKFYSPRL